ncbi:MAG: hypothetical protein A2908_00930 [Candidatus Staskawiczbacteria bacterium RIFCSPLOWO2_01_FULL_38_12b]|uniref:Uncharacterized protein n=1 Tax=Candidatus Staskawiczbacteria bacterium RIFCSPLOWO2_01_FULL_38_12b TaxID=1802214 RepID=A0A1G2IB29_9BACT|nr:MAG: hypothetical protein A2908_00930 [Candidatus Staskawiczbacteria bacterium RIFCSPLOWO2_01_FULL_38_12b]
MKIKRKIGVGLAQEMGRFIHVLCIMKSALITINGVKNAACHLPLSILQNISFIWADYESALFIL